MIQKIYSSSGLLLVFLDELLYLALAFAAFAAGAGHPADLLVTVCACRQGLQYLPFRHLFARADDLLRVHVCALLDGMRDYTQTAIKTKDTYTPFKYIIDGYNSSRHRYQRRRIDHV